MLLRSLARAIGLTAAVLMFFAPPHRAQVPLGSETQVNLDGSISGGYSSSMTNEGPDGHGFTFGGAGNLAGSFHSPQFLSFNVSPFFNQSRNNSTYQSITDSSGMTAGANIFGGSRFPGYVNYAKIYNSESIYSLPGIANYATNGNSQTFGVGWSANLKDLPSLAFGYQQGSSDYSLYGTQQFSLANFHSLFGTANYTVDRFHLSGGIRHSKANSFLPQIVVGQLAQKVNSDNTVYTLNMSRALDREGSTWVNFTRASTGYDSLGLNSSQTADIVTGGLALRPTGRLTTQFSADYNDNFAGSIFQTVVGTGATAPLSVTEAPSHSWGVLGSAQYTVMQGLYASGSISHRQQLFLGESFDSTAYAGSLNYGHNLLGGQFTAAANVSHNSYGFRSGSMLGLLTNVIYIRRFGLWNFSGSFGYSENVQSLFIAYTTSGYGYSVSLNRRIGSLTWTGGASASSTLLTRVQSPTNFTQAYTTGLSGRWLSASGAYSKSSGSGLLTPTGVVILPPGVPPPLVMTVFYGGRSYSASLGSSPKHGLSITGTYVNSRSSTQNGPLASLNKSEQAYVYMSYRFRKVYFNAGYSRLLQGFSTSGLPPALVSTYYFGVSRWFKVF